MDNREAVKEFTSGNSITLEMKVTPEDYSRVREWSLSIPTLYILDICVVSATKYTSASLENQPRKANLVNKLRELNLPNNCFSYLFALMEKVSDSRGIDTDEELEKKILSDLDSLRRFFTKAHIYESNEFILGFLKDLRGNPIEKKRSDYLGFLKALNDQFNLRNSVSNKQRLEIAEKIIAQADSFNFSKQHPVVFIGLACLYGNHAAKKLMKFKENSQTFNAENVLADIMLITRFANFKLEIEQMGRNGVGRYIRLDFITDDDGLIEIMKCFTPSVVKHIDKYDGQEIQITMTVELKDLLTEIPNEEEYDHLLNLLNKN